MLEINSMLDAVSIAKFHDSRMSNKTGKKTVPQSLKAKEGEALKAIWDARKPMSQAGFAREILELSEGYLPQFFGGIRPLTLDIAEKFAKHLKCEISDFSPRLAKEKEKNEQLVVWPFPHIRFERIAILDEGDILQLEGIMTKKLMELEELAAQAAPPPFRRKNA